MEADNTPKYDLQNFCEGTAQKNENFAIALLDFKESI
jgi:hypothetical protein